MRICAAGEWQFVGNESECEREAQHTDPVELLHAMAYFGLKPFNSKKGLSNRILLIIISLLLFSYNIDALLHPIKSNNVKHAIINLSSVHV
jgi:hypothetical protein